MEEHMAPAARGQPAMTISTSCVPRHWLNTTALASGWRQLVEQRHQLVGLDAVVGFLVEQPGAVAGHAHVLQRALQAPLVGVGQEAGLAPARTMRATMSAFSSWMHRCCSGQRHQQVLVRRSGSCVSTSALRRRSRIGASVWPMRSSRGSR
jgi:hypothetical protein